MRHPPACPTCLSSARDLGQEVQTGSSERINQAQPIDLVFFFMFLLDLVAMRCSEEVYSLDRCPGLAQRRQTRDTMLVPVRKLSLSSKLPPVNQRKHAIFIFH